VARFTAAFTSRSNDLAGAQYPAPLRRRPILLPAARRNDATHPQILHNLHEEILRMNEHLHRYATRLLERQQAGAGKVLTMQSYGVHQRRRSAIGAIKCWPRWRKEARTGTREGGDEYGITGGDLSDPLDAHSGGLHGVLHCPRAAFDC
jgi:hypothetical protein